ncbi:MAG: hypothetical protein PHD15_02645 [Clostridia bacterium]|nr:hypothetical protein [Clostridia bacterium]MDD4386646.1 hypothetical protein [Clostridia bacterium]
MKLDFKIQCEELNLAKLIDDEMAKKPKKVYMFIGTLKESGFNILEESIVDTKSKIILFMGIDKKNTTKGLLDDILKYTKEIYVYNNNNLKEFESNIYIFESEKIASIYLSPSNMSEGGLVNDLSVFCRVEYTLNDENDNKEYKNNLKNLMELKKTEFTKLDKNLIQTLLDTKVIFSNKQYEHNIKSISEFLGKKEIKHSKELNKNEENSKVEDDILANEFNIPIVDLSSSNIEIDISDVVETEIDNLEDKVPKISVSNKKVKNTRKSKQILPDFKENELDETIEENLELFNGVVDLNTMLLTKSKVRLNTIEPKIIEENTDQETIIFKKLDLNNISNYIFELPAKQQNCQDLDVFKIPNYIREIIPNFFEFSGKTKSKVINGIQHKIKDIQVEIVDVKNNTKVFDINAKMMQKKGQTYMTIMSKYIENIDYEEKDIVRIIKLSSDIYHIEIVSKDMQEYRIWSKIINKKLKGVDRRYGIM